ncbi:M20 family metallo-hydrolase [Paenibacillus bovis]|uniref:Allantoate amidohydrolase n=1 Tax=Paenibacillus bovis TaxID=1616788 RepID=A0A172ZFM8_9BACL|nr:M20 family metallo-hydrolase [Paenibacillus bovis]ANF96451.1 allantoate amidohydrolase [Paenibacillus bovis]
MVEQTAAVLDQYSIRMNDMLEWLSGYGADEQGGVTRLLYSREWIAAQEALSSYMKEQGLETFYDQAGNLTGRLVGSNPDLLPVVTGSHIDTVICGGKYDGTYGVVAGILALAYLQQVYGPPVRTIDVISLCEEEGSRFPLTYWGSGNIAGNYSMERIPAVSDREGITLEEAMSAAGFGPDSPYRSCLRSWDAYIELHIEQGFVLERSQQQIGIVNGIVGQRRIRVSVGGESNHAGTTPMGWRRDSLACAAEMITCIRHSALEMGDPLVATVGSIQPSPGVSNVIAGETIFTLDIRHLDRKVLDEYTDKLQQKLRKIASQEGMDMYWEENLNIDPVLMHPDIITDLQHICESSGIACRTMPSGAGHDAQVLGSQRPAAMIFVPSRQGISHNPLEYTADEDLMQGFRVLTEWLYQYAYRGECHETL